MNSLVDEQIIAAPERPWVLLHRHFRLSGPETGTWWRIIEVPQAGA